MQNIRNTVVFLRQAGQTVRLRTRVHAMIQAGRETVYFKDLSRRLAGLSRSTVPVERYSF